MTDQPQHHDDAAEALAARMLAGETITEDQAVDVETQAAGRRLYAAAIQKVTDARAAAQKRKDDARRQAAVDEDARTSLSRSSPAVLADLHDEAARTLAALIDAVDDRTTEVGRLVGTEQPDRPSGVGPDPVIPTVVVDDHEYRRLELHPFVESVLRRAGVWTTGNPGRYVIRRFPGDVPDPAEIAAVRAAQAAA